MKNYELRLPIPGGKEMAISRHRSQRAAYNAHRRSRNSGHAIIVRLTDERRWTVPKEYST